MQNLYKYIGPPGCGKTETLRKSVEKNAHDYTPNKILCCSLTVNAASVLRGRIVLPERNVGTLHSICYHALGCPALTVKKEKEFSYKHIELSSSGMGVDDPLGESRRQTDGDKMRHLMEMCRAQRLPKDQWPEEAKVFDRIWSKWKEKEGLLDFTDLLEKCLAEMPIAPGMPSVIIGDEAQDWSKLALDLLLSWGKHATKVILAGDANQTIFRFSGADPRILLELDVPEDHKHALRQSWRIPRAVHEVSECWLKNARVRENSEFSPRRDENGAIVEGMVERGYDDLTNLYDMADQIDALARNGKTVMVMASCGYHVDRIVTALRNKAIPFHNPLRNKDGSWNPLRSGSMADRVRAFIAPAGQRLWTKAEAACFLEMLPARDHWKHGLKDTTVTSWAKTSSDATPDQLREVLEDAFCSRLFDMGDCLMSEDGRQDALRWLQKAAGGRWEGKLGYASSVAIQNGPEALWDVPKVSVGTIHSCKGGEADVVYLFPDLSYQGYLAWTDEYGDDARDDVVRMFYVGMTRARERLVVCQNSSQLYADLGA